MIHFAERETMLQENCVHKLYILDLIEGDFAGMTLQCCLSINGIQGFFGSHFLFIVVGC